MVDEAESRAAAAEEPVGAAVAEAQLVAVQAATEAEQKVGPAAEARQSAVVEAAHQQPLASAEPKAVRTALH